MLVKNKKSGETENLRYGAAMDAVTAGTHELVNTDGKEEPKSDKKSPAKADEKK